jgi:4-amino-4-deoxy-L-arabinose transferase-like glycosyltransferase
LVVALALLAAPALAGHIDDLDAQLYRVVVRNMVESGHWLDLSFVPGHLARFREHLPFTFWPAAIAGRLFGTGAMDPLEMLLALATVAVVLHATRALLGDLSAIVAGLVLATTEGFWHWGGRVLPEPLLWVSATASAVQLLREDLGERDWIIATALASVAAVVKGPFGLAPLACAAAAAAIVDRSPRKLLLGALSTLAAVIPVVLFLASDKLWLHLGWWEGYGRDQLLASAVGSRHDGARTTFMPFFILVNRFWPGIPLVFLGVFEAVFPSERTSRATRVVRILGLWCLFLLLALCIPSRKWGTHTVVAFAPLAMLAGGGIRPLARLFKWRGVMTRGLTWAVAIGAVASVAAALLGVGKLVQRPPCAIHKTFGSLVVQLPKKADVLVVSEKFDPAFFSSLAEETQLSPWPDTSLSLTQRTYSAAFVRQEQLAIVPGWKEIARDDGWVLLVPSPEPRAKI